MLPENDPKYPFFRSFLGPFWTPFWDPFWPSRRFRPERSIHKVISRTSGLLLAEPVRALKKGSQKRVSFGSKKGSRKGSLLGHLRSQKVRYGVRDEFLPLPWAGFIYRNVRNGLLTLLTVLTAGIRKAAHGALNLRFWPEICPFDTQIYAVFRVLGLQGSSRRTPFLGSSGFSGSQNFSRQSAISDISDISMIF